MVNTKFDSKIVSVALGTVTKKQEVFKCPDILPGKRYKLKSPTANHATYILIFDIEKEGKLFPYEIFITTKDPDHQMWVQALTRVISAIFRRSEDITFLIEELKSIFDPKGGYRKKGGVWSNSLIAEIGEAIELHVNSLNGIVNNFPEDSLECMKCFAKAVVILDGCKTCLNCGDSKCS